MSDDKTRLRRRISELRRRGFRLREIGAAVGVNLNTLPRWELGLGIYDMTIDRCGGYPAIFARLDELESGKTQREKHTEVAAAIRELERRRWTKSEIAREVGVHRASITQWAKGTEWGPARPDDVLRVLDELLARR